MKGDKNALDIWAQYGFHLGNILKAILYTYDPEAIVLGGSISKAYSLFEKSMKTALTDFQFPETIHKLKIMKTEIDNIALLGAAALVR